MNGIAGIARDLGLGAGALDAERLLITLAAVAAAIAAGLLVRTLTAPRIRVLAADRLKLRPGGMAEHAGAILGAATAIVLLVAAGGFAGRAGASALVLAGATGTGAAHLAYHAARGLRLGARLSAAAAAAAFMVGIAASLGSLDPLTGALAGARIDVGKYSISLLGVLNALVILVVLYGVTRLAMRALSQWIAAAPQLDLSQRVLTQKLVSLAIVIVAIFVGIDLLGIDLTALAVFSGALGLAIGFGMQKTLGNLLSGIILLMDKSIKPGDVIVVGDTVGWVNKIGIRAVSVLTRDAKEFLIPNETLMTETVENWSYSSRNVRVKIPVGVAYTCDIKRAQALMLEAAKATPRVLADPAPNVWLKAFGDNAVEHDILIWINDAEEGIGNVQSAVLNRVWDLFKADGIEIPFPQRDVHIRSFPPSAAEVA